MHLRTSTHTCKGRFVYKIHSHAQKENREIRVINDPIISYLVSAHLFLHVRRLDTELLPYL